MTTENVDVPGICSFAAPIGAVAVFVADPLFADLRPCVLGVFSTSAVCDGGAVVEDDRPFLLLVYSKSISFSRSSA